MKRLLALSALWILGCEETPPAVTPTPPVASSAAPISDSPVVAVPFIPKACQVAGAEKRTVDALAKKREKTVIPVAPATSNKKAELGTIEIAVSKRITKPRAQLTVTGEPLDCYFARILPQLDAVTSNSITPHLVNPSDPALTKKALDATKSQTSGPGAFAYALLSEQQAREGDFEKSGAALVPLFEKAMSLAKPADQPWVALRFARVQIDLRVKADKTLAPLVGQSLAWATPPAMIDLGVAFADSGDGARARGVFESLRETRDAALRETAAWQRVLMAEASEDWEGLLPASIDTMRAGAERQADISMRGEARDTAAEALDHLPNTAVTQIKDLPREDLEPIARLASALAEARWDYPYAAQLATMYDDRQRVLDLDAKKTTGNEKDRLRLVFTRCIHNPTEGSPFDVTVNGSIFTSTPESSRNQCLVREAALIFEHGATTAHAKVEIR